MLPTPKKRNNNTLNLCDVRLFALEYNLLCVANPKENENGEHSQTSKCQSNFHNLSYVHHNIMSRMNVQNKTKLIQYVI